MPLPTPPATSIDPRGGFSSIVVFFLGEQRYGVALGAVDRIVRSVEVALLPKSPEVVLGVVDVQGQLLPVVDIRRRFGLPSREIELRDHMIVARTNRRRVVLVADAVSGVIERHASAVTDSQAIAPGLNYVNGVMRLEDGLIFIHDLESCLSLDEEQRLEQALQSADATRR